MSKKIKLRMNECFWKRKKIATDYSKLATTDQEDRRGKLTAWGR